MTVYYLPHPGHAVLKYVNQIPGLCPENVQHLNCNLQIKTDASINSITKTILPLSKSEQYY